MTYRPVRSLTVIAVLLALAPAVPAAREGAKPEDLVLVRKGTLPIIVSAPHGGRKAIPGVAERTKANVLDFSVAFDTNTFELTERFTAALEKKLDGKAWVVAARFSRKYLDANRPRDASYESEKARPYYDLYHDSLEAACKAVKKEFGRGLLLDIHGQGVFADAICRGTQNGKTVTVLKDRFGWAAVTGKYSVLGHMERRGYKVLPACDAGEKTKEESKFNGGYTVQHYGSHTGYAIDAIQLEFGTLLREKERDHLAKTADDLADAVAGFYREYLKDAK